jgi:hypothetical protein
MGDIYKCRNCDSPVKPDDVLVEVTVTVPRDHAVAIALTAACKAEGLDPDEYLVVRDAQADAYWLFKRGDLRVGAARVSGARVISHGADLTMRQALSGIQPYDPTQPSGLIDG